MVYTGKRRAWIPLLAFELCLILDAANGMWGLSHSMATSFAFRITAAGQNVRRY